MRRINFPFWAHKVLPLVYDDSLSYYEILLKLFAKINEIIDNNNLLEEYIGKFIPTLAGEWDSTRTYDPLTIVTYNGNTYIATKEVPAGTTPDNTEYWNMIDYSGGGGGGGSLADYGILTPDEFTGTDTDKLEQAVTECANGGVICLNREYVLDDDWVIDHLSSRQEDFIHIIGLGKNASINLNGHNIVGSQQAGEVFGSNSVGGIFWQDVNFKGTANQNGFITDRLIRMFFTGCHFYGMNNAFFGNDSFTFNAVTRQGYAQSYYFAQCYFGCLKTGAFNVFRVFDVHFTNCVFEYDNSGINVRHAIEGLYVESCLMENILGVPAIRVATAGGCYNFTVAETYFEDNVVSVDLGNMNYFCTASIENCMCSINRQGQIFIHMPRDLEDKYGISNELKPTLKITGNCILNAGSYDGTNALYFDLFRPDGSIWSYYLTGLLFENNNFELTNSNASMEQIYTLNYRPINKAYTRKDTLSFVGLFNSAGSGTLTAPASFPPSISSDALTIYSLKSTLTGQDICVDSEGNSVDPNTWYSVQVNASGNATLAVRRDSQGEPIPDRTLMAQRAGNVPFSVLVNWNWTLATAPGRS